MGWNNQAITQLVINAIADDSGLFVYSGAPAFGNLVAAITGDGVLADPYGNIYAGILDIGGSLTVNEQGQVFQFNGDGAQTVFLSGEPPVFIIYGEPAETGIYVLNDDFDGGTWTDYSNNVHNGSSGIAGTSPATDIWTLKNAAGYPDFGSLANTTYVTSTSICQQDGNGNLNFYVGSEGTDGAAAGTWPCALVDTGTPTVTNDIGTGSSPQYAVLPGQSCEIKAKIFPLAATNGEGSGAWPACWFVCCDSVYGATSYGEVDMQESGDPGIDNSAVAIWGCNGGNAYKFGGTGSTFPVNDGNYHIYRFDLAADAATLTLWRDGVEMYSITQAQGEAAQPGNGWPFSNAEGMFVILNVAVGGVGTHTQGFGTPPPASLPALVMSVDYVQIWEPAGPNPNSAAAQGTPLFAFAAEEYTDAFGNVFQPGMTLFEQAPPASATSGGGQVYVGNGAGGSSAGALYYLSPGGTTTKLASD